MSLGGRRFTLPGVAVFLVVAALGGAIVAFKVAWQMRVGMGWDSYAFLVNAAEFAGKSVGYAEPHRPPFMSFLTSLYFRFAPLQASALQVVDGLLTLCGILGMYLLLRKRFDALPAGLGALSLIAVPPLWSYLGAGYSDTPSVAISIWVMVLLYKATEEDDRWYLAAFPLLVAAVLTRYGALLMALPATGWLIMRSKPFRQVRSMVQGIALSILTYVPAGLYFQRRSDDFFGPFVSVLRTAESTGSDTGTVFGGALLTNIVRVPALLAPEVMSWATGAVLAIAVLGLFAAAVDYIGLRRAPTRRLVYSALAASVAGCAQVFGGLATRQAALLIAVLVCARMLKPAETEGGLRRTALPLALDLAMLHWGLAYLDAHGHMGLFVPRYFITMAPAVVYFVLLGWSVWAARARGRSVRFAERFQSRGRSVSPWIPSGAVWLALGLVTAGALAVTVREARADTRTDPLVVGAERTAEYLREHDRRKNLLVYSDLWPLTSWYLGREARPMPFFKDRRAFAHELDKYDVDYFVTIRGRTYDSYRRVYSHRGVSLLKRIEPPPDTQARVQHLGGAWQNYLEQLCDYRFELIHPTSIYGRGESQYIDSLDATEPKRFAAASLYAVRWRDKAKSEAELKRYVEDGGVLIIDASGNLGDLAYPLDNTILLNTVIRRDSLPEEPRLRVSAAFSRRHGLPLLAVSPFVNEGGGRWFGARYEPVSDDDRDVLASLDGKPAVMVQRLGKGRVYWIGYNLVWHAFLSEDPAEAALIRAIMSDALDVVP